MKNIFSIAFAVVGIAFFTSVASSQIRQTKLYIDDGNGNFTILQAPFGGGTVTMPSGSGTLSFGGPGGLPSGAIVAFPDNTTRSGFTYTGTGLITPGGLSGGLWATGAAMPTGEDGATRGVVNGKIYVFGGSNNQTAVQIYDPSTDSWGTPGTPMPTEEWLATSAVVNGKIYVFGGESGSYNSVQIYDPTTPPGTWTTGTVMPTGEYDATSAVVNGKIYVIGGASGSYNAVQIYDPSNDSWGTPGTAMPTGEYDATSAVVNGKIYVIGGASGSYNAVQIYDPTTPPGTWTTGTVMPTGEYAATSGVVNDNIYVFGGRSGSYNAVQIYDPTTPPGTWTTGTVMPTGEYAATSGVVNGLIYTIGGANNQTAVQIYSPGPEVDEYFFTVN